MAWIVASHVLITLKLGALPQAASSKLHFRLFAFSSWFKELRENHDISSSTSKKDLQQFKCRKLLVSICAIVGSW